MRRISPRSRTLGLCVGRSILHPESSPTSPAHLLGLQLRSTPRRRPVSSSDAGDGLVSEPAAGGSHVRGRRTHSALCLFCHQTTGESRRPRDGTLLHWRRDNGASGSAFKSSEASILNHRSAPRNKSPAIGRTARRRCRSVRRCIRKRRRRPGLLLARMCSSVQLRSPRASVRCQTPKTPDCWNGVARTSDSSTIVRQLLVIMTAMVHRPAIRGRRPDHVAPFRTKAPDESVACGSTRQVRSAATTYGSAENTGSFREPRPSPETCETTSGRSYAIDVAKAAPISARTLSERSATPESHDEMRLADAPSPARLRSPGFPPASRGTTSTQMADQRLPARRTDRTTRASHMNLDRDHRSGAIAPPMLAISSTPDMLALGGRKPAGDDDCGVWKRTGLAGAEHNLAIRSWGSSTPCRWYVKAATTAPRA